MICVIFLLPGCGGKKSDNPVATGPPEAVSLVFPDQNAVCLSGTVISATQSAIQFKWNGAANADSFDITVKNLLTAETTTQSTSQTQANITLARNTPYSWYITSKSSHNSTTVKSESWKFYNSGTGITSYAPYPADKLVPSNGQYVTVPASGGVSLTWQGSAPSNNITGYDIYFGNTGSPPLYKSGVTASSLDNVMVVSKTKYYWKVVTHNGDNNTSVSDVIQFNTN
jgi:hypothetical protein